jgi:hypothetical protein
MFFHPANFHSVLNKLEIPTKVSLPGVGENLQDQPNISLLYSSNANTTFNGSVGYVAFGAVSDFLGSLPPANLSSWATSISTAINNATQPSIIEHLLKIQYDLLANGVVDAESLIDSTLQVGIGPSNILANPFWLLMPFSRGNIHITSSDPTVLPAINPNFFLIDFDLTVQIAIAKWSRRFWAAPALAALQMVEISPGFAVVAEDASEEVWGEWIKSTCKSLFKARSERKGNEG